MKIKLITISTLLASGLLIAAGCSSSKRKCPVMGMFKCNKSQKVSVKSLLNEMVNRDSLTKMPKPYYTVKQFSSYDRKSVSPNAKDGEYVEKKGRDWGKGWFANRDFTNFIRVEEKNGKNEFVLFDHKGPGAVVRFWQTGKNVGNIKFYLDGSKNPTINMNGPDLIGSNGLVGKPFSFLASNISTNPSWRGSNLYFPIPYQKSCKITYVPHKVTKNKKAPGLFYYNINYRAYESDAKIKTFTMADIKNNQQLISEAGEKLVTNNDPEVRTFFTKNNNKIAPNKFIEFVINRKNSAINKLNFTLKAKNLNQALRSTVISVKFDNKQTIWSPVGSFFGIGYGIEKNKMFYLTATPKYKCIELDSTWTMPFQDKAVVTIYNYGKQDVTIQNMTIKDKPLAWNNDSMYFHATWFELRAQSSQVRKDINYVTVNGEGRYVGDSLTIFNTKGDWWGEGDEKIYIDGEKIPSTIGTGTEDYYGYAWCRPQRFYQPFISQPRGEGNKKPGYSTNNRMRALDDIPFKKSIKVDMELWHPYRSVVNYAPATFFYAKPNATWNIKPNIDAVKLPVALTVKDVMKELKK